MNEPGPPVITAFFASREIRPGDMWKVYLNAAHPAGEMKYIVAEVSQPGNASYPVTRIRVKGESRKNLSGYVYLSTTFSAGSELTFASLMVKVQIEDRLGRCSRQVIFSLAFNDRAGAENPPPGLFEERDLGPIMVRLQPKILP